MLVTLVDSSEVALLALAMLSEDHRPCPGQLIDCDH